MLPLRDAKISRYARYGRKRLPICCPKHWLIALQPYLFHWDAVDSYRTKKKWETFAFIEGEPLTVNVQIGKMGSLASELLRAGFQPKDVNFLTVEGKMDEADFTLIRDYMPNLVSIDMTNSNATAIPDYTFTQKKYLLNVRLPQELRSIGQRAFSGCGRLCGTLVLPASVTAIEYGAFMGMRQPALCACHGE